MIEAVESSKNRREATQRSSSRRVGTLALLFAGFALVLWGGYGQHWRWTGISGRTATLWDWLHLLLLPVAVGVLPIWLSRRTRLTRRHKSTGFGALSAFAVLVLVGYIVPWAWTGFYGNTLWDWLELLALPLAVALAPLCGELRATWDKRHSLLALIGLAVFLGVVLEGYLGTWRWTGFRGNTVWNWLHLFLLPLLIPTVVVPALVPMATAGLVTVEEDGSAEAEGENGAGESNTGGADWNARAGEPNPGGVTQPSEVPTNA
jgi:hypothetical protein